MRFDASAARLAASLVPQEDHTVLVSISDQGRLLGSWMNRLSSQLTKHDGESSREPAGIPESHAFKGGHVIAKGIHKKEKHHACPSDRGVRRPG